MRGGYDWWEDLPNEVIARPVAGEADVWYAAFAGLKKLAEAQAVLALHCSGLTFTAGNLFSGKGTRTSLGGEAGNSGRR